MIRFDRISGMVEQQPVAGQHQLSRQRLVTEPLGRAFGIRPPTQMRTRPGITTLFPRSSTPPSCSGATAKLTIRRSPGSSQTRRTPASEQIGIRPETIPRRET